MFVCLFDLLSQQNFVSTIALFLKELYWLTIWNSAILSQEHFYNTRISTSRLPWCLLHQKCFAVSFNFK